MNSCDEFSHISQHRFTRSKQCPTAIMQVTLNKLVKTDRHQKPTKPGCSFEICLIGLQWHHCSSVHNHYSNDDVIEWKHFPRNWSFVRGIRRSPANSLHKGQWHGALMFSFISDNSNENTKSPSVPMWRNTHSLYFPSLDTHAHTHDTHSGPIKQKAFTKHDVITWLIEHCAST